MKSARQVASEDKQLAADGAFPGQLNRYDVPAASASVATTVAALKAKRSHVEVFDDEPAALAFLSTLVKDGESVALGGSTTLSQVGFTEHLKTRGDAVVNLKAKAIAAQARGDMPAYAEHVRQAATADWFFSSVYAVTEDGCLLACDYGGGRTNGWLAAKRLVVVAGTNKIARDEAAAEARLLEYQLPLESARLRSTTPFPFSQVVNKVQLRADHPIVPRVTVVLINKALGF